MTEMDDDDIRNIMLEGFEHAFQAQLGKLFEVFLSSGSPDEQAVRTKRGIENAVEAYKRAVSAVDSWSSEGG
jgi:hypothetical protein